MTYKNIYFQDEAHKDAFFSLIDKYGRGPSSGGEYQAGYYIIASKPSFRSTYEEYSVGGGLVEYNKAAGIKELNKQDKVLLECALNLFNYREHFSIGCIGLLDDENLKIVLQAAKMSCSDIQ